MRLTKKYYGNTSASIKAINYCKKCSRKCPSTNKGFVKWYLHTSHSHMQTFSIYQSMEDVEVQSWICKWMTFHLGRNKLRHLGTSKAKQSQCRRVKRQNRLRHLAGLVCFARGHGAAICFPRLLVLCHSLQLRSSAACKPHTGGEQNLLFHPVPARAHHVVGTHCSVTDGTHLLSPFFFLFLFWREDWYLCPFAVIDWTDGATFELKQTKDHARFQAFRLLSLTGSCRVQMFNHRAKRREPVTLRICFAIWETELCSSRHRTDNITQTAPVQQTRELNLVTQMSLKLVETETSLPAYISAVLLHHGDLSWAQCKDWSLAALHQSRAWSVQVDGTTPCRDLHVSLLVDDTSTT